MPHSWRFCPKLDATAFPPNTIFVFTCNATDNLERRFLSRCRTVEFSSYGMAGEITGLLSGIWERETQGAESPNFQRIVKESCNNVRDATDDTGDGDPGRLIGIDVHHVTQDNPTSEGTTYESCSTWSDQNQYQHRGRPEAKAGKAIREKWRTARRTCQAGH